MLGGRVEPLLLAIRDVRVNDLVAAIVDLRLSWEVAPAAIGVAKRDRTLEGRGAAATTREQPLQAYGRNAVAIFLSSLWGSNPAGTT